MTKFHVVDSMDGVWHRCNTREEAEQRKAEEIEDFGNNRYGLRIVEVPDPPLTDAAREHRYREQYKLLHGHEPGEPHTEGCTPDPWHPDRR